MNFDLKWKCIENILYVFLTFSNYFQTNEIFNYKFTRRLFEFIFLSEEKRKEIHQSHK